MARVLILVGLLLLLLGMLWPWLRRLGLGKLPGDIAIQHGDVTFYIPIVTCLVVSVVLSLVLWLINR